MNISNSVAIDVACPWCGSQHGRRCPFIKSVEYHQDGQIKRVEFFGPSDYTIPSWVSVYGPGYSLDRQ